MHSGPPSAGRSSCLLFLCLAGFFLALPASRAAAQATGGFIEAADSTATRTPWTASQIRSFLPPRGPFTFPAPYNTEGIRLTNATDCGDNTYCPGDAPACCANGGCAATSDAPLKIESSFSSGSCLTSVPQLTSFKLLCFPHISFPSSNSIASV